MGEERKIILRMVQEGKISLEEAEALLDALQDPEAKGEEKKKANTNDEEFWSKVEKQGEDFAQKIESAAEKYAKALETKLEGGLSEKLSKIPKLLSAIPVAMFGEVFEFNQEFSGSFQAELAQIPVEVHNTNGKIQVEGWDEDTFKLEVTQKIRGENEDAAKKKQVEIPLIDNMQDVKALRIRPELTNGVTIHYKLYVPRRNPYEMGLKSTNGSIAVENLVGKIFELSTSNGSVTARQIRAEKIVANSSNGSSKVDYAEADRIIQVTTNGSIKNHSIFGELNCSTTNGSIVLNVLGFSLPNNKVELSTTNGSVRCSLPPGQDVGYKVSVSTGVGRATVSLDGFESELVGPTKGPSRKVVGQTMGFSEKPKTVGLFITTSAGSVSVQQKEGE